MEPLTWYVLSVMFFSALVRSAFGFGESLIAVPLLIFYLPIEVTVPLSLLMSVFIAAVVVVQDKNHIQFSSVKWLIIYAILGIPFGLLLIVYADRDFLKYVLGLIIVGYSLYSILSKRKIIIRRNHRLWLFICGFLSGVFGGAFSANGPPLVVYGNLMNWSAKHFRATLQVYFLPVSSVALLGFLWQGLWTWEVTRYFLYSVPVMFPAILLGRIINHRLKDEKFKQYVYIGLLLIGSLMFF